MIVTTQPTYIKNFFKNGYTEKTLKPEDIEVAELSLINLCNLKCPMCLRQNIDFKMKVNHLDLNNLKRFLNDLPNLKRVVLMGAVCEPTLYPHIFELLEYMNTRNIKVRLSTNGSTKIDWARLGKTMKKGDIIRFPVDGSTQELHSKYRVGSKLADVLEHHKIFKENSEATTIMQFIQFDYNRDDEDNIKQMYKNSTFDLLEICPCYEPPNLDPKASVKPRTELLKFFKMKDNLRNDKSEVLGCPEAAMNAIYLNHMGILVPCNEQEDYFLDKPDTININKNTTQECFDFMNNILKNIRCNEVCKRACSKMGLKECFLYPIFQLNRENTKFELVDFRECMLNR
ncbi:putative radical SAM protein [Campylobacter phage F379]|uniref:Putative radical SAM protein n=1 Tax=Campylobacter phage F379 TaxID=2776767 RepID=A0A7L8ZK60_9CAUD|nr:radical SAM protein [Campylobacter jejuni]QOI69383.1 putative radical SAM protein [Campylobacter phage F379]RTH89486.1 hypothetical protein C3I33_08725 [Campylobacter jejuni]RTH92532.1 hypothetical protein C3I35_08100 [Campylobacter jejuni]RTI53910.1 hypothetical protein C3I22_08310 [Campylobacter jejuni]